MDDGDQFQRLFQIIKRIHRGGKYEDTINEAKENMKLIPDLYKNVQNLVPEGAFYKFHDIWRLSTVKVGVFGCQYSLKLNLYLVLYDNVVCDISREGVSHYQKRMCRNTWP